jgi:4-amino-4-deoxy-L-arabinose transferase-like glycosyltransferase
MPRSSLKTSWSIPIALLLGLVLRVWFVVRAGRVDGDGLLYSDIARNWLQHGVYGFSADFGPPHPTLIRLPGYPLFLATCFRLFGVERYAAIMAVQVLADLLTCILIAALANRLFGRRAALAALWLAALCPFTAVYTASILSETLTLLTIALAFYAFERWRTTVLETGLALNRWLWIIGPTLAYALLLRPEQALLAAAILPAMAWIAWQNRPEPPSQLAVLLAILCIIFPLAPWTARNWRTFHVFQPIAPRYTNDPGERIPRGFFRWYRTWAIDFASTETIYWNYNGNPVQIADLPTRAFDSNDEYRRAAALFDTYNRTVVSNPTLDAAFNQLASERIQHNPIRYYIALPTARLINMILRPRAENLPLPLEWWKLHIYRAQSIEAFALAALNLAYLALAAYGLWLWRRASWSLNSQSANPVLATAMVASILLRCALLLTIDNSEPRYTLEFYPVLIVLAAAVFTQLAIPHTQQRPSS